MPPPKWLKQASQHRMDQTSFEMSIHQGHWKRNIRLKFVFSISRTTIERKNRQTICIFKNWDRELIQNSRHNFFTQLLQYFWLIQIQLRYTSKWPVNNSFCFFVSLVSFSCRYQRGCEKFLFLYSDIGPIETRTLKPTKHGSVREE